MAKLTVKGVEALVARAGRGEKVRDWHPDGENGLSLRIRASGHAAYYVRKGGYAPIKVCDFEAGLAHARKEAAKIAAQRAAGADPSAAKKAAKAAKVAKELKRDLIRDVVDDFVLRHCKARNLRSTREIEGVLRRNVLPHWGGLRIGEINRAMVADLMDGIMDRGHKRQAGLTFAVLRTMFGWAVGRGLLDHNPLRDAIKPPKSEPRKRVLTPEELRLVWLASEDLRTPYRDSIRLLMISGQRKSEVAKAPWSEFDLDGKTWSIPEARTKNGVAHRLPLPPLAVEILSAIPRDCEIVFHAAGRKCPAARYDDAKKALDARITELNGGEAIPHWTLHDLRRSVATHMGHLKVLPHVIECALNHVGGFRSGVAGIYNHASYWDEMADAFGRWDAYLRRIISGADNVVTLAERRA